MSGVKHTTWEVAETIHDDEEFPEIVIRAGRIAVAVALGGLPAELQQSNARLIAAAPDLLEALIALVDRDLTYHGPCIVIPAKNHGDAISIVSRARDAIARARGEQDGGGS